MRNKTFLQRFSFFMLTCMFIGVALLSTVALVLIFAGGTTLGMSEIVGGGPTEGTVTTETVKETSPDLDKDVVDQMITKMRPAATPLDTIMRQIKKVKTVHSLKTEYYAVDIKPFSDTIDGAQVLGGVTGDLAVNNVGIWNVDDTVMFPNVAGSDGNPLVCSVYAKSTANGTISLQPLNNATVPAVVDADTIVRMAPAKSELDAQTSPFAVLPGKDYNYMQNFMAQVEESTFQKIHEQEVNWDFSDYEEMNIYDMKARMEMSYLWGIRSKFTDVGDDEVKYACGGLTTYMSKVQEYTAAADLANGDFVDWTQYFFADNAGSDMRILFAEDDLLAKISKIPDISKQLDAGNVEVKWGINFNRIETKFGQLLVKRHPLMRLAGMIGQGIVFDIQNIEKHVFKPMGAVKLDLKKSGQRNADAVVLQEVSCPILRYPSTHALIKPV